MALVYLVNKQTIGLRTYCQMVIVVFGIWIYYNI
jgi:hypothetical protein